MRYLKKRTVAAVLRNVSSIRPVMISHHTGTPRALVTLLLGGNIMVKTLTVLMAHFPGVFWDDV
jgi:hypothetical protein